MNHSENKTRLHCNPLLYYRNQNSNCTGDEQKRLVDYLLPYFKLQFHYNSNTHKVF